MALLVGIDVGTTNWKAIAFQADGNPVSIKKTPAVARVDAKGQEFYDAGEIWADVSAMVKQVVEACGKENIAAVAVTSSAESVVPLDWNSEVHFPVIAWFDTRARKEAEDLIQKIGKKRIFEITGLDPNPIFPLLKILWIKKNYPEVFKQTHSWLQLSDFVNFKLCNALVTDYTLASRTLAFNIDQNNWSEELLSEAGVPLSGFPEVVKSGKVIGKVNRQASIDTGLLEGTPVVLGGHDHPCATVPTGVYLGGKILDSSGTAESFLLVSDHRGCSDGKYQGQRVCRYLDPSRYVIWGGIIASGASVDWGIKRLAPVKDWGLEQEKFSYKTLATMLERTTPGANGVMYLPHLRGSGPPDWDPRAKGAFLGLKSTHTSPDLMRALFEGLSFQARIITEMEERISGAKVEALCTVGGGARLMFWQQIKADIIGKTIEVSEFKDATAYGAALLAGVGVGIYKSIEDASKEASRSNRRITPDPENAGVYNELFEIYQQANSSLVGVNTCLDAMFSSE